MAATLTGDNVRDQAEANGVTLSIVCRSCVKFCAKICPFSPFMSCRAGCQWLPFPNLDINLLYPIQPTWVLLAMYLIIGLEVRTLKLLYKIMRRSVFHCIVHMLFSGMWLELLMLFDAWTCYYMRYIMFDLMSVKGHGITINRMSNVVQSHKAVEECIQSALPCCILVLKWPEQISDKNIG